MRSNRYQRYGHMTVVIRKNSCYKNNYKKFKFKYFIFSNVSNKNNNFTYEPKFINNRFHVYYKHCVIDS